MAHLPTDLTNDNLNIYKIARTIGHATRDLGKLCKSVKNNMFSRFKPMYLPNTVQDLANPTAQDYADNHYGVYGGAYYRDSLFNYTNAWVYERPQDPYNRIRDYRGYFHKAVIPFMQANGTEFVVDAVQEEPDSFCFYMLFRDGRYGNKPFKKGVGIDTSTTDTAVPAADLPYNMTIEDLVFDTGAASGAASGTVSLLDNTYHSYLGFVIFNAAGTVKKELFSESYVSKPSEENRSMYIIRTTSLVDPTSIATLPIGIYKAIACAKYVGEDAYDTFYMPVYSTSEYPAKFNLNIGGLDKYEVQFIGVCDTNTSSSQFVTALTVATTTDEVFVKVRFRNKSGRQLIILPSGLNRPKIGLRIAFSGSVSRNGQDPIPISRNPEYRTTMLRPGEGTTAYSANIIVADKNYVDIVYRIQNIWSEDGTSGSRAIESGNLTLALSYRLANTNDFTPKAGTPTSLTVTA